VRIAAHRLERPTEWTTIEEPLALGAALDAAGGGACVVVDCLALWTANVLTARGADAAMAEAREAARVAAERAGPTLAVTNEVGMGVVPATPLGREFRDVLGTVNALWSRAAAEAFLVVAGRRLALEPWPS
jgi:adenosyl cobinamide kinase/adenosyl cobinamide phosphate guanylyltransferase